MLTRISICMVVFFTSLSPLLHAQGVTIGVSVGMGTYNMAILRETQNYRLQLAGVPAAIVTDFPMNWDIGGEMGFMFEKAPSTLLAFFQFNSTGSRVSSCDYSGEYNLDMIVDSYQFGIGITQKILEKKGILLSAYCNVSSLNTKMKMIESLRIYNWDTAIENHFTSPGFGVEPGISFGYRFPFLRIVMYCGFLISSSKDLLWNSKKEAYLILPNNKHAQAQWDGFRFGLKLNLDYHFYRKSKSPFRSNRTVGSPHPSA